MATGSKIRTLARQLDGSHAVVWVIDAQSILIYVSAGAAEWLRADGESLVRRRCATPAAVPDDPLDRLVAALAPPPGLDERRWLTHRVMPPDREGHPVDPRPIGFARVGEGPDSFTFAVGGSFPESAVPEDLQEALSIRRQLDAWRKSQALLATIAMAGTSPAARRTRGRVQLAISVRSHIGFYGPSGCGAVQIAARVHHLATVDEPIAVVDGPLMDAELLDATLSPLITPLTDHRSATATVLLRGIDETPMEAQQRLVQLLATFAGRLRLLATSPSQPQELVEPFTSAGDSHEPLDPAPPASGIHPRLVDALSIFSVTLQPLASRPEDIPLIAAALVDARRAAGEGTAERLSRGALDALVIYPWPGDFDELDASVRHAVRSSQGSVIKLEDLPLVIRSYRPGDVTTSSLIPTVPLEQAVSVYEQRLIREAIESAGGNRAEAARRLGISRAKLLRRMGDDANH